MDEENFTQEELSFIGGLIPMIKFTVGQSKQLETADSILKKIKKKIKINNEMKKPFEKINLN